MTKVQRILIPIDFSDRSGPAIQHGVNIAKHFDAETVFLHAVPGVSYQAAFASSLPGGMLWTPGPELERDLSERLRRLVDSVVPGQPGECLVIKGAADAVIADTVKKLGINLVVMPTAGVGPFRRYLLGSVTAKVLNDVDCPVLTGAHVEDGEAFAAHPVRRIGFAADVQEDGLRVAQAAADFAGAYEAKLVAVHALPTIALGGDGAFGSPEMAEMAETHARTKMTELLQDVNAKGDVAIEQGSPETAVPHIAKERDLDLLVIGRHGKDGFLGGLQTHAYGIIRHAECPVLSV